MKLYNFLWVLIFGFQFAWGAKPEIIESKVIKRSFEVSSTADIKINNRYGNVNLSSWNQNKVDFHIEIQVDGKDAQRVKDRLDAIKINFSSNQNFVAAETLIENIKNQNNVNISIHYFVKLPKTNNVYIQNQYGNIDIDNLKGSTNISLKYGNFTAGQLQNAINLLDFDYVTKASVDFVQSASINLAYSKMTISKSELINTNARYSDISLGEVHDLINNISYGNLSIQNANAVTNASSYSNIKIENLRNSFVFSGKYGSISISHVKKGFNKVSIGSNYISVTLGIDKDAGYKLEGNFKYGSLSFPQNVNMSKEIQKGSSASYEGSAGNGSGDILLNMTYGNAKIK